MSEALETTAPNVPTRTAFAISSSFVLILISFFENGGFYPAIIYARLLRGHD
jgi:hypothetical protein